ncbi:MAG: hypothetical protein PHT94_01670 [Candidatus Nanoarchaeia archaeon]|nr:hypothetical protein [Candidatus Nanoarchaeia archaeon]
MDTKKNNMEKNKNEKTNTRENLDEDFEKYFSAEIKSNNLIEKEYTTIENMRLKQKDSYISAREILEIIKLEKMQQMNVKKFISSFDYEFILNIETIRSHINITLRKVFLLEKKSLEIIKENILNSKMIEKMFEEMKDERNEDVFDDIGDLEMEELDIVETIREKIKKLSYFKSFRQDLDLINSLKIISENYEDSKDEDINRKINEFIDLVNNEYKIIKEIIKLILKKYSKIKEEKQRISK